MGVHAHTRQKQPAGATRVDLPGPSEHQKRRSPPFSFSLGRGVAATPRLPPARQGMTHSRNPRSAKYVPPDGGDKIAQVQADDYALDDMRKDHSASSPPGASAGLGGGGDNDDGEAPPPDYKDDLAHHSSRDAGSVLDLDGGDNGGFGPAGDGSDGGSIEEGEVYRLYKRRWFGLVAIIFLNIIASWDVSWGSSFFYTFPLLSARPPPLLSPWEMGLAHFILLHAPGFPAVSTTFPPGGLLLYARGYAGQDDAGRGFTGIAGIWRARPFIGGAEQTAGLGGLTTRTTVDPLCRHTRLFVHLPTGSYILIAHCACAGVLICHDFTTTPRSTSMEDGSWRGTARAHGRDEGAAVTGSEADMIPACSG